MQRTRSKIITSSLLVLITGAEIAKTKLVFCRFDIVASIIALFAIVVALYLAQIAYCFAQTISVLIIILFGLNQLGGINFDS